MLSYFGSLLLKIYKVEDASKIEILKMSIEIDIAKFWTSETPFLLC
jgi:hypothetical protein